MEIYHFAPAHMINDIKKYGLMKGMMPLLDIDYTVLGFKSSCQWLTMDSDWNNQHWATQNELTYDRTAYRAKIIIPKTQYHKLCIGTELLNLDIPAGSKKMIRDTAGYEMWAVFIGNIPSNWIKEVTQKPRDN